jgi:hypothetical protein
MNKPTESSTESAMGNTIPLPLYEDVYSSPETLEHLKDCEAREWISRRRRKIAELGSTKALQWWKDVVSDIERRRGKEATDDLRRRMTIQREMSK